MLCLLAEDIFPSIRDPKNFTETIRTYMRVWQIATSTQKSIAFIYTNSAMSKKELIKSVPVTIAKKILKPWDKVN